MDELECHQKLHMEYQCVRSSIVVLALIPDSRNSFFDVVNLFGPAISGIIANRHRQIPRLLIHLSKSQDDEIGDGTTVVVGESL